MKLDYVLRYFFHTSIEFSNKQNKLVSMDGTIFDLNAESLAMSQGEGRNLVQDNLGGYQWTARLLI